MPSEDFVRFEAWRQNGLAGEMTYLTDRRGNLRGDPRHLLPEAQTILCVGKLYNTPAKRQTDSPDCGRISRYAWGEGDYHDVLREGLNRLAARIAETHGEPFAWRACVDTAPLLERSYAHAAGLGWIGKNTCLINQESGSWFFLGEMLLSLPIEPNSPAAFRCGTCTRCIEACPTAAIVPGPELPGPERGGWSVDSNLCISYLTIEKRGPIEPEVAGAIGNHLFGCDICQDVCPWNRRAPFTAEERFADQRGASTLADLSDLTPDEFRDTFRRSPVWRTKYEGFLRNVAIALGNSSSQSGRAPLEKLAAHPSAVVASAAEQGLARLDQKTAT